VFLSFYFCFFVICAGIKSAAAAHAANVAKEIATVLENEDTKRHHCLLIKNIGVTDRHHLEKFGNFLHFITAITFNKLGTKLKLLGRTSFAL
jgi:hypothetical protein